MKNEKWRHQDYASGGPMCSPFDGMWTNHRRGIAPLIRNSLYGHTKFGHRSKSSFSR